MHRLEAQGQAMQTGTLNLLPSSRECTSCSSTSSATNLHSCKCAVSFVQVAAREPRYSAPRRLCPVPAYSAPRPCRPPWCCVRSLTRLTCDPVYSHAHISPATRNSSASTDSASPWMRFWMAAALPARSMHQGVRGSNRSSAYRWSCMSGGRQEACFPLWRPEGPLGINCQSGPRTNLLYGVAGTAGRKAGPAVLAVPSSPPCPPGSSRTLPPVGPARAALSPGDSGRKWQTDRR